jgi:hypothetical protein
VSEKLQDVVDGRADPYSSAQEVVRRVMGEEPES